MIFGAPLTMANLLIQQVSKVELRALIKEVVREELTQLHGTPHAQDGELLKAKDVARLLKCSVQTVYNYRRRGIIKSCRKAGRSLYFSRQHIDEALKTIVHPKHLQH